MSRRAPATGDRFQAWIQAELGDAAERWLEGQAAYVAEGVTAFRWNTLGGASPRATVSLEARSVPGLPDAGWVPADARETLTRHPEAGRSFYIQSLSSQLAGAVLVPDERPGVEVLDLAAAPGGKTLDLLQRLGSGSHVAAVEPSKPRFHKLRRHVEAAVMCRGDQPHATLRLFMSDGRSIGRKVPGRFDAVLLDTPCSAEARIRPDEPSTSRGVSPKKVRRLASLQKVLLRNAIEAVRPGGEVLYCTCTANSIENEAVVADALAGGEVLQVDISDRLPTRSGLDLGEGFDGVGWRVWPSVWGPAFYLALLRRAA